jgi:NAD(P)-dependent dehydrogenase (short-subunit alcohol dehydrogenase family)
MVPPTNTPMYMYAASKAANVTLTEGLRRELLQMNSKIRITVSSGKNLFAYLFSSHY